MTSRLREAREAAGYSIEYVADKLNIRKQYLLALEEGNYEIIPGKVYEKGYKKLYCEFLGVDYLENKPDNNLLVTQTLDAKVPIITKKYTKYIIIGSIILLAIVVALYDFLKAHPEELLITTQSDDGNDGSRQESSDIPYKTD
jgi:transcriptional regulator with XRE-family HTH domain